LLVLVIVAGLIDADCVYPDRGDFVLDNVLEQVFDGPGNKEKRVIVD